jgi:hypothetical protein
MRFLRGCLTAALVFLLTTLVLADGKMVGPKAYKAKPYKGSIEEQAQEAIIIFHGSDKSGGAVEDLILKVSVAGEVDRFAWVIPFPNEPKVAKEDTKLFKEVHAYVEAKLASLSRRIANKADSEGAAPAAAAEKRAPVEVLSRKIVGAFDVAVVRENQAGALNGWLDKEGYQSLDDAEDILEFYRGKKYVYACIKVSDAPLNKDAPTDLHPLRFTFKTGGRDGIFFPMKMTGLQRTPFSVNLYIFYRAWLNDHLSKYGYEHRGFRMKHRDWDTKQCEPNAGKKFSAPHRDAYLRDFARLCPTVAELMQKLHPGEQYYLTNIQARNLKPENVRQWKDDLWLFPYYTDRSFVPFDARPGAVAAAAWEE